MAAIMASGSGSNGEEKMAPLNHACSWRGSGSGGEMAWHGVAKSSRLWRNGETSNQYIKGSVATRA